MPDTETFDRELVHIAAPLVMKQSETEDGFFVKGFASVETIDRSDDFVPADEFNIPSFMAKAVLLFNHRFWVDKMGNPVAIGKVKDMIVAKLAKNAENPELFNVVDVKTKEMIDTFPKVKAPDLGPGTRGLWVVAEITVDEVTDMVRGDELTAFSWRGLAKTGFRVTESGETQRILKDIDLFEISLVHVPDNGQAIFTVAKGGKLLEKQTLGPMTVQTLRLDKSRFETEGMVVEYLRNHDLRTDCVREDQSAFFATQKDLSGFDSGELVSVKLCDGVQVVAGPLLKIEKKEPGFFLLVSELDESTLKQLKFWAQKETPTMSDDTLKSDDQKVENTEKKMEEVEKNDEQKSEQQVTLEKLGDAIATRTAEKVAEGLKDVFSSLTDNLKALGDIMKASTEAKADDTSKDEDVEETDGIADTDKKNESESSEDFAKMTNALQTLADGIIKTSERQDELDGKLAAISKSVAGDITRDEQVETSKDVGKDDPNSIFDSLWPFTSPQQD